MKQYTKLVAPLAWRACETFIPRTSGASGTIVLPASDVFMLGCTFIEVLTGCSREPYDWLMAEDPEGMVLIAYRVTPATRNNNPLTVCAPTDTGSGCRACTRMPVSVNDLRCSCRIRVDLRCSCRIRVHQGVVNFFFFNPAFGEVPWSPAE